MGIPVFSSPYGHSQAVAELCICFIVLLARQVGDRSMEVHRGEWNKVSADCYEIRGKTLGVLGYGHVGVALGILAESVGMKVIFYDILTVLPHGRNEPVASLDDLVAQSDFLSIHVTAGPENKHLIGKEQIAKMKKGSYIINAGYAGALDLDAVAAAVKSKHLGGVAVDVFPNPPEAPNSPFTSPLMGLRNVIMTPNIGDGTAQAVERVGEEVSHALVRFVTEGSTVGSVNFPSINAWPIRPNCRRITNVHQNVRGVLREIDAILSAYNVGKQVLETMPKIGYLIADIETEGKQVTTEIVSQMALLSSTIRTRIL
ncbi:hypothetical protein DFJ74DRAFT_698807 [Hyaloraphidium curvatum]|nr:hypothetical protein DFJ74DRAFT_698807 [Hyaloraphidium curvatum]